MKTLTSVAVLGVLQVGHALAGFVTIGQPGNPPDALGRGTVDYSYQVADQPVTTSDFVDFLNTTQIPFIFPPGGPVGTFRLAGTTYQPLEGQAAQPVTGVDWLSAARYVNWLHNGRGAGGTETGAYDLEQVPVVAYRSQPGLMLLRFHQTTVPRSPQALYWLPTFDEYLKAGPAAVPGVQETGEILWIGEYCRGVRDCFGTAAAYWSYASADKWLVDPGVQSPGPFGLRVYAAAEGRTLLGDADADADVDSADLLGFLEDWTGQIEAPAGRWHSRSDTDRDADVDSADLLTIIGNWTGAAAQVPEPSGWKVAVLVTAGLWLPRVRKV